VSLWLSSPAQKFQAVLGGVLDGANLLRNGPCTAWQVHLIYVHRSKAANHKRRNTMAWTTPVLIEICIGLEINGYLPAEF
jgi:coenzyme PQQ precursor peptide PqqA